MDKRESRGLRTERARDEPLPPHVEESVRAVEKFHSEHHGRATGLDRSLESIKAKLSAPLFVIFLALVVGVWILVNLFMPRIRWDGPPFAYLELGLSASALLVTILILATQRRADTLAAHREQLILQLAFVSEQKATKLISLMEEQRRDSPQMRDRVDPVAEQMTEEVDPAVVSEALRNSAEQETGKAKTDNDGK